MPFKRKIASKAVRDPVRKGHFSYVGISPSLKAGVGIGQGVVQWESRLERDCVCLLEFSTSVVNIQHQPEKIQLEGKSFSIPDFSVDTDDGRKWIIEVKPADKVADPKISEKLEATAEIVNGRGDSYVVLTEQEIRRNPIASNLAMLGWYRRPCVNLDVLELALEKVTPLLPTTYDEILRVSDDASVAMTLLAFQRVEWDYTLPLKRQTVVSQGLSANRMLFQ